MRFRASIFKYSSILLICLVNCFARAQSEFKLDNDAKRVAIPLNFVRNLIVVKLTINNKGPYNFVLDTGVGLMIITDPKLVDSLNIKNKRSILVAGLGQGKDFEAYVTSSLKVNLPGISGVNISAAILKKDELGLSHHTGMPIHGLLGYEFFNSFAVRLNFDDSTIVVGKLKNIRIPRNSTRIPLSIENNKSYVNVKTRISPNGELKTNKLILDIGAGHPLSLENLVGENNGLPDKFIASNLGISLTGPVRGYLSRISDFEIGKYKLKNIVTSFPELDSSKTKLLAINREGNLGIKILKKFNVIIDYQSSSLYIKPNASFKTPLEHDMSGLEYYADGRYLDQIFISNVERGSAGEEIGLQNGDEIITVNFKPVSKMTIDEIDRLFSSRENRSLLLEVSHDNQRDKVIIKLKQRI